MKIVSKELSPILAKIIDELFKAGAFPNSLKNGKITPIYKTGDYLLFTTFEKLLYTTVMSYLSKCGLLSSHQFGFRPGVSTELTLLNLTDQIKQAVDDGLLFGAVFIDLTKAFDTNNHSILLPKLESFGIIGPPLELIRCY